MTKTISIFATSLKTDRATAWLSPAVAAAFAVALSGVAWADETVNIGGSNAVNYMAAIKRPVTVVATSRGTIRAAEGIARGARPDRLVLASGFLTNESGSSQNVASILGSPAALPPTLIIHHRQDGCRFTQPAGVESFARWAGGRARVAWVEGGIANGDPCETGGHHGFNGLDARVVGLATGGR